MNTHKNLQAQLGHEHYYSPQPPAQPLLNRPSPNMTQTPSHAPSPTPNHHMDDHDETLRALLAASAMSDLGNAGPPNGMHNTSAPTGRTPILSTRPPTLTYSRSNTATSLPMSQPLYIPTSQPFTSPSPHPSLPAPLNTTTMTTSTASLSLPLSAPVITRPPLQSHHSFTNINALDSSASLPPHQHTQHTQHHGHNGHQLGLAPPHHHNGHHQSHHRRVPSLRTQLSGNPGGLSAPHSASAIPGGSSRDSFAAALAGLDAYSRDNDLSFGNDGTNGGAAAGHGGDGGTGGHGTSQPTLTAPGAAALMAGEEIGRPQSQPVLPVAHHSQHLQRELDRVHAGGNGGVNGVDGGLYGDWENIGHGDGHGQGERRVGGSGLGGGFVDVKREDVRC
jgi:hypothetical protein